MKVKKTRLLALLLAVVFVLSACGQTQPENKESSQSGAQQSSQVSQSSEAEQKESSQDPEEVVTLTILMGNNDIDTTPWYQTYLEENLGINLQFVVGAQVDALLAAKDLPDLIFMNNNEKLNIAIHAGMLLNLDEYKDQLPSIYENDLYDSAINYSRLVISGGTEDLYVLPSLVGMDSRVGSSLPHIRWDYYKEMGYPEVNSWDELLVMLKDMQDKFPETEDGLKTYGLSLFKNWDANFAYPTWGYYGYHNGIYKDLNALVELRADQGSSDVKSKLDDDSDYKAALQFFFDANQMGILDPDSATQTYDNAVAKVNSGQVLLSMKISGNGYNTKEKVNAEDWSGYAQWWPDYMAQIYNGDWVVGNPGAYKMAINSECENLDKALEFMNWFYSYEGAEIWWNGPEGVLWDEVDGKKVPNDNYYNGGGVSYTFAEGGSVVSQQMLMLTCGMSPGVVNPATGQEVNIFLSDVMKPASTTNLMKDWYAHNGEYTDALAKRKAEDGLFIDKNPAFSFIPAATKDETETTNLIGGLVIETSWKMIFAKDQAEFEALWDTLQADAKAAGLDQVVDMAKARLEEAEAMVAQFIK